MKNCKSKMMYDIVYEYFKDIEYTYEVLKEIDGKNNQRAFRRAVRLLECL